MKIFKKFCLPMLMGAASGIISAAFSLALFVYVFPAASPDNFNVDSISLAALMLLSSFLLYAAMLLCRKFSSRISSNAMEEASGGFSALFLVGAALAAGCSMLLALVISWSGAASLVMICYMIICELIAILAFFAVMFLISRLLKRIGTEVTFLNDPKWNLLFSLLFFALIFIFLLVL